MKEETLENKGDLEKQGNHHMGQLKNNRTRGLCTIHVELIN